MKNLLIISYFLLGITTFVYAQDTIIEHPDFYLHIQKVTEKTPHYESIRTGENFEVLAYEWKNVGIRDILEDWMTFLELEEIEYRIDENVEIREDLMKLIKTEELFKEWQERKDSMDITKLINSDVQKVFMGYNVIYQQNEPYQDNPKAVTKAAFEAFCSVLNLEVQMVKAPVTYWKLEIVDTENAAFSYDQNTHWKRTDTEEYIFYERIKYRRVADLLGRKLDAFVKPIPYNTQKFDIRMPHSDDVFDLKYAMIEHGLELTEVTEEIDVMVIKSLD